MIQIDERTSVYEDQANAVGIDGGTRNIEPIAFGFTRTECENRADVQDYRDATGTMPAIVEGFQSGYRGWVALAPTL